MKDVLLTIAVFGSILLSLSANAQPGKVLKARKPNIIFILTDDLGYGDVGVLFQNQRKKTNNRSEPFLHTPNIDKLALQGTRLTHHYTSAPVCAPARASLLLGMHQGHANVRDNQFDKALSDNHTIASTLRKAGYTTAAIGKWGLQGKTDNEPDWPAHPLNRGFDYYFGYIRHNDGHEHYPKEGVYRGTKQVWDNRTNITSQLDKCYTTDVWTARTKKWIIDFKKQHASNPFFIYLAYETPHAVLELPTQAYPAGGGLNGGMQWTGETGRMINTASGKVDSWIHPDYVNATYDNDKNVSTPEVPWPDVYKRYATSIRRIDDGIGDIRKLLKDLNIEDNTLIVFTSDNGPSIESYLQENFKPDFFNSFGPFDGIKRDCLEGGVRIPTIATWPGKIAANAEIKTPNAVYDWLPTFTDAAGLPAPASADGVSLLPALTRSGKQRNGLVYIEYNHRESTPDFKEFDITHHNKKRNQMQLIRFGDTVGLRYNIKSHDDNFEIYNIVTDPQQTKDLAANGGMNILQKMMKEKVLQVRLPDTSAKRPYDKEYITAVKTVNTRPGMRWSFYKGNYPWIPEISTLSSSLKGVTANLSIETIKVNGNGIIYLEGFLNAPADGEYTFYLSADTGAFLRIHDAAVIDADFGYTGGTEVSGKIRLKAGLHPFRLYSRIKNAEQNSIDLDWESNTISKQQIPAATFFY